MIRQAAAAAIGVSEDARGILEKELDESDETRRHMIRQAAHSGGIIGPPGAKPKGYLPGETLPREHVCAAMVSRARQLRAFLATRPSRIIDLPEEDKILLGRLPAEDLPRTSTLPVSDKIGVDEVEETKGSTDEPTAKKKVVPKLILTWEETDFEELSDVADMPHKIRSDAHIGGRLSRVLSGDATGLGIPSVPLSGVVLPTSKTLSGEILQRRLSEKAKRYQMPDRSESEVLIGIIPEEKTGIVTKPTYDAEADERDSSKTLSDKARGKVSKICAAIRSRMPKDTESPKEPTEEEIAETSKREAGKALSDKMKLELIQESDKAKEKMHICRAPCSKIPEDTAPPEESTKESLHTVYDIEASRIPSDTRKDEVIQTSDLEKEKAEEKISIGTRTTEDTRLPEDSTEEYSYPTCDEKHEEEMPEKYIAGKVSKATLDWFQEKQPYIETHRLISELAVDDVLEEILYELIDDEETEKFDLKSYLLENITEKEETSSFHTAPECSAKQKEKISEENEEDLAKESVGNATTSEDVDNSQALTVELDAAEPEQYVDQTIIRRGSSEALYKTSQIPRAMSYTDSTVLDLPEVLTAEWQSISMSSMLTQTRTDSDYPMISVYDTGIIMSEIVDRVIQSSSTSQEDDQMVVEWFPLSTTVSEAMPKEIQAVEPLGSVVCQIDSSTSTTDSFFLTVPRSILPLSTATVRPTTFIQPPPITVMPALIATPPPMISETRGGFFPSFFFRTKQSPKVDAVKKDTESQTQGVGGQDENTQTDDEKDEILYGVYDMEDTDTDSAGICHLSGLVCDCRKDRFPSSGSRSGRSFAPRASKLNGKRTMDARGMEKSNRERLFEREQEVLERRIISVTPKVSTDDLPTLIMHKDAENMALKNALAAKESFCAEQRKIATAALEQLENIKNIAEERDDLRKKLESSQNELEQLKKNIALGQPFGIENRSIHVPFGETSSITCEEEITILEREIDDMRGGNLTPDLEARVIRKEVEVLKKYCSKLSVIQKENQQLKLQVSRYEDKLSRLGFADKSETEMENLKMKLDTLDITTKERDNLRCRCLQLEKQLYAYNDLPEDVEVFKQRSMLLDEVLLDRDRLSKRVEQLRGIDEEVYNLRKKSIRVEELQESLSNLTKEKKRTEEDLDHMRCRCSVAEIEAFNEKAEGDTLRSRITCLEHEVESLKCMCKDKERLKQERDHLKRGIDEMARMEDEFDHMKTQMKCLEVLKAERDMFKAKYENVLGLECECDILRAQVDRAKTIEVERDALELQVEDLENCIAEQENEIRRLVCHIDVLAKGRDDQQGKLRDALSSMRSEIEKKDSIIQISEEKLASVQTDLKNSIQGLSGETSQLKNKNEQLEKRCCQLQKENKSLHIEFKCLRDEHTYLEKDRGHTEKANEELRLENDYLDKQIMDLTSDNDFLMQMLHEKENSIKTLQEVLKDHEPLLDDFERAQNILKQAPKNTDTVLYQLYATKQENKQLPDTLARIGSPTGDDHLRELLKQSKCAVQRIALEMSEQYEEWDNITNKVNELKEGGQQKKSLGTGAKSCICFNIGTVTENKKERGSRKPCKCMEFGMTTDNPLVWDCADKEGLESRRTYECMRLETHVDHDLSMWTCKTKKDLEGRKPCECMRIETLVDNDPSMWTCKAKKDFEKKRPCECMRIETRVDPSLWTCQAKKDIVERRPCECMIIETRVDDDPSMWTSNTEKDFEDIRPCECMRFGISADDPLMWDCKDKEELGGGKPCDCMMFGISADDPLMWDCKDKREPCDCMKFGRTAVDSHEWDCRERREPRGRRSCECLKFGTGTYDSKLWSCRADPNRVETAPDAKPCDCSSKGVGPSDGVNEEVRAMVRRLPGIKPCKCVCKKPEDIDDKQDRESGKDPREHLSVGISTGQPMGKSDKATGVAVCDCVSIATGPGAKGSGQPMARSAKASGSALIP
ncbi:hypothetical protein JTB14_019002 [Gonioctena quinquepunctata]|nr:hypothetical protein JTB14_019002 [Gonioctena quinquepunctata]